MGVSGEYKAYVAELLADLGPVSVRSMFGGAGVFLDGVMFGLISSEVLYLKVDDRNIEQFETEGCSPFTYETSGKPRTMKYWSIPERLYDDADELVCWARVSYEVALAAKSK